MVLLVGSNVQGFLQRGACLSSSFFQEGKREVGKGHYINLSVCLARHHSGKALLSTNEDMEMFERNEGSPVISNKTKKKPPHVYE